MEKVDVEEVWSEGGLSLAASWAVIEVGFSKEIPISVEAQEQCGQRRMYGEALDSSVAVTESEAKQIGQEKQFRVHL